MTAPPRDTLAEEAVIAACLLDPASVLRCVGEGLQPADFFDAYMGRYYQDAIAVTERGDSVDLVTLAAAARQGGYIDAAGGEVALVEMVGRHFSAASVESYARIVIRDATYRRLIQAGGQIARIGYEADPDIEPALEAARLTLEDVQSTTLNSGGVFVRDYIEKDIPEDDRRLVSAGFTALDQTIRGLGAGELLCIGARTDQGKTALAVGMAYRQCRSGTMVAFVPVEGSVGGVLHRMAAITAKVSIGYGSQHGWTADEQSRYWRHYSWLNDLPLIVPEKGKTPRTGAAICSWITRQVRQHGIRVAYIDHIDAVRLELGRGQALAAGYADLMKQLQELAGREDISIVFMSQVNRESRMEKDMKTPPMAYMRESGTKEEASQTVLMLGLEQDPEENGTLHPLDGQWLWVHVDKLKDYAGTRNVGRFDRPDKPALYLDNKSGAIRERGEQVA